MASFKTVLQHIGQIAKKVFDVGLGIAEREEPVVAKVLPGISELFNSTVSMVSAVEMAATGAGAQDGTGAQKLANVAGALEPLMLQFLAARGIVADRSHVENWISGIVQAMNAIPEPTQPLQLSAAK